MLDATLYRKKLKQVHRKTDPEKLKRHIHVIFSWAQIGRSAIFGREIGVPDREIFSRQKKIKFNVKNCLFARYLERVKK